MFAAVHPASALFGFSKRATASVHRQRTTAMDGQGDHTMSREASGEVDVDQVPVRLLAGKQEAPAAAPTTVSEDAELAQFSPDTDSEAENIVNRTTTQMGHAHRRRQRVGAVAGIALLVVLAAGVAVAVLVSNASKPKIALPEEFSGSFATADAYNPDVRYAGRVHKRVGADGRAEFEAQITHVDPFSGNRMVYTLINHRAYVQVFNDSLSEDVPQRVYCYPEEQFPPVGDVEQLLQDASVVPVDILDANNPGMAPCLHSGNRWLIKWGRQHFVICRPENDVHRVRNRRALRSWWAICRGVAGRWARCGAACAPGLVAQVSRGGGRGQIAYVVRVLPWGGWVLHACCSPARWRQLQRRLRCGRYRDST